MDLQEVGCGDMDWIELAQDRDRWPALVTTAIKTNYRHLWLVCNKDCVVLNILDIK